MIYDWQQASPRAHVHNHTPTMDQLPCHPCVQPYIITSITSRTHLYAHSNIKYTPPPELQLYFVSLSVCASVEFYYQVSPPPDICVLNTYYCLSVSPATRGETAHFVTHTYCTHAQSHFRGPVGTTSSNELHWSEWLSLDKVICCE